MMVELVRIKTKSSAIFSLRMTHQAVVAHIKPSTQETEAGGPLSVRSTWSTE